MRYFRAIALMLFLSGCGLLKMVGEAVFVEEQALKQSMFDWFQVHDPESIIQYKAEDKLDEACGPLEARATEKKYGEENWEKLKKDGRVVREYTPSEQVLSIFYCKYTVTLICEEHPYFCPTPVVKVPH